VAAKIRSYAISSSGYSQVMINTIKNESRKTAAKTVSIYKASLPNDCFGLVIFCNQLFKKYEQTIKTTISERTIAVFIAETFQNKYLTFHL
jgi:hypothetical protein